MNVIIFRTLNQENVTVRIEDIISISIRYITDEFKVNEDTLYLVTIRNTIHPYTVSREVYELIERAFLDTFNKEHEWYNCMSRNK